jgi:hypothetical protein
MLGSVVAYGPFDMHGHLSIPDAVKEQSVVLEGETQ